MDSKVLVDETAAYVRNLYATSDRKLYYHNLDHAEHTVKAVEKIAKYYDLREEDEAALTLAAWFHDIGYLIVGKIGHEEKSAELAEAFLKQHKVDDALISKVKQCILATKMPQQPTSLLEEIMCDADLYDLSTERFKDNNKKVRKEVELHIGKELKGSEWRACSIEILKKQQYKTEYARTHLQEGIEKNIKEIEAKQAEKDTKEESSKSIAQIMEEPDHKKNKEGDKKEGDKINKGVETMFRTTSTNHLRLSEMADNKANIMITVNSIIISVLLTLLFRKLEQDPRFLIPSMLLLFTSLTTIVFSIIVTTPNVTIGTFTKEDIHNKRANLLFFGNFYKMSMEDYEWGIQQVMKDSDFLYGSMTRDIYHLGVVLGKKYKMLRIAYSFFMFGFIISVLSFVVAVLPMK